MTVRRAVAGAFLMPLVLMVGACTSQGPTLPNLGGGGGSSPGGGNLAVVAQAFHDCLVDAGLPAAYRNDGNGQPTVVTFDDSVEALGVDPDGLPFHNDGAPEAKWEAFATNVDTTKPSLQVDGIDQTSAWVSCHQRTGYRVLATYQDAASNPFNQESLRLSVESSNQWAQCARGHGFPQTKDAVMPTDSTSTPMALLPPTITEPQLRQLLVDCPNFDAEQAKKNDELMNHMDASYPGQARMPDGVVPPPSIGFDYPGFRGIGNSTMAGLPPAVDNPSEQVTDMNDPTVLKLIDFQTILNQPMSDYYASSPPG